jgi:SAM-dependent methyltransferase
MWEGLRRRRAELDAWLVGRGLAHTVSLPAWQLQRRTLALVRAHARGRCLDAGAGRSPWRAELTAQGARVVSLDRENRSGAVDLIADLMAMPAVASASFDTVLCTQVLEHVPRPGDALAELARVLAPGGHLILSVPHLSMLHELPHDYFRFTRHGLEALCAGAGLRVVAISACGGLVSLLAHGASLALLTTLGSLPGLRGPVWALNYALLVRGADWADRLLGLRRLYPCNYVVLARREGAPAA